MSERMFRMAGEMIHESRMKQWHNDRGLPWGTPFEGPDPVVVSRQVMPNNIKAHLANEHGINPDSMSAERRHVEHAFAHMYGKFQAGQGHYHAEQEQWS